MKKYILVLIILVMSCAAVYGNVAPLAVGLEPQLNAMAYQQYEKRPKTELSKLLYLMDLFKGTDYIVVYDKMEYDSKTALKAARNYIARHFERHYAFDWVETYTYRTAAGEIIYLKSPDGKTEVLRDVLFAELRKLGS